MALARLASIVVLASSLVAACASPSTTPGPEACLAADPSYPQPTDSVGYGCAPGDIVEDFTFKTDTAGARTLGDYHTDPNTKVLVWHVAAGWCQACRHSARNLEALWIDRGTDGARVVTTLIEDDLGNVALPESAAAWKMGLGLTQEVLADADCGLGGACGTSIAELPTVFVIDPRDMTIVYRAAGDAYVPEVVDRFLQQRGVR